MKWRFLLWLVLFLMFHTITRQGSQCERENHSASSTKNNSKCSHSPQCKNDSKDKSNYKHNSNAMSCMEEADRILNTGHYTDAIKAIESLEDFLDEIEVTDATSMSFGNLVASLYKPIHPFKGLKIHASDSEAMTDKSVTNSKVNVQLPEELDAGPNNTIVFCMITWPHIDEGAPGVIYENRLVGLSVSGKNISGLHERVNITMNVATAINETQEPRCVFLNFSTLEYSSDGCITQWEHGQTNIICSCTHLTYFGVLMVTPSLSSKDQEILSYITLIGCSLSLIGLIITVLLFITNRHMRADVSMKVHINLAVALILLNVHFLPSQQVAALPSTGLCLYMALALHYSLLATFSWMALEGVHLYILLVRVFNIYIRRYLLKLSVVGWGIPAVIVSLVVIIDRSTYGHVPLDLSKPNDTAICYITNNTVKIVTTEAVFGLVFVFNLIMLGVMVRRVVSLRQNTEFGQNNRDRAKRDIFTLLGVTTLLGITWGLVFVSITTPGLYLFCILNSLQGFFIFLWFVMSLRKAGKSASQTSSETRTTS
ncbi:adhesion G-protein coupled receptor G1-like isoform X2 [Anabas testudineus]|uniref:adhesion G-protein coupled receptor G1-like isoform X2 n=1 Tax=Anabas testudineus TaxID=64144 RepID=UPI000E4549A2|nr:adhesion G-protein coupled receptor G1-like isoform X2 [Anabas testudineus]